MPNADEPNLTRRQKIEAMLVEDPSDLFLQYSLAMELQKESRYEEALAAFEELMEGETAHVASFFMAAQLLARLDRANDARRTLRSGIEQARRQNDQHAAAEMSEFLASLGGE